MSPPTRSPAADAPGVIRSTETPAKSVGIGMSTGSTLIHAAWADPARAMPASAALKWRRRFFITVGGRMGCSERRLISRPTPVQRESWPWLDHVMATLERFSFGEPDVKNYPGHAISTIARETTRTLEVSTRACSRAALPSGLIVAGF